MNSESRKLARLAQPLHTIFVLQDEQPSPEQIAVLRGMTPDQRWRATHRLYWTVRRHKTAFLRSRHPEWSEEQLNNEVRDIFFRART